jgi:adhesin transport system outer membrane protein
VRKLNELVLSDEQQRSSALERVKSYRLALQDSRWVAESWDRQFIAGKKSWQDVVNAVREVTQLEVQLAEAQVLVEVSAWRLAVLTQGTTAVLQPRALRDKP